MTTALMKLKSLETQDEAQLDSCSSKTGSLLSENNCKLEPRVEDILQILLGMADFQQIDKIVELCKENPMLKEKLFCKLDKVSEQMNSKGKTNIVSPLNSRGMTTMREMKLKELKNVYRMFETNVKYFMSKLEV